jgi:hypothetical protein
VATEDGSPATPGPGTESRKFKFPTAFTVLAACYDRYVKFVWLYLVAVFIVVCAFVGIDRLSMKGRNE